MDVVMDEGSRTVEPGHRLTYRQAGFLPVVAAVWLAVAVVETVIADLARWPAQFGGAGSPAHVTGELATKGTALSPPLFMIVLLLVGLAVAVLAHGRAWRVAGSVLAGLVGAVGVVGALGEVVAAATPDVPRAAQLSGLIGVVLSLALVVAAILAVARIGQRR